MADGGGATATSAAYSTLERLMGHLDRQITRFVSSPRPIWSVADDAAAFLENIDTLLGAIADLDGLIPSDSRAFLLADDLLHRSMLRLEREFQALLDPVPLDPRNPNSDPEEDDDYDEDHIPVAKPVTDYNIIIDALPWGTISDLNEIARRMVAARFGKECSAAYSSSRRDFVEESISRLGLHHWTREEVHGMPQPELEDEIQRWIHAAKVSLLVLFPSERRLADRVFAGLPQVADLSYAEICHATADQLLEFAVAVARGNKVPERLFRIVDMYEALRGLLPDVDSVFSDQYCSHLRAEYGAAFAAIGAAIRGIFTELENLIRRDPPKSALPGGGVHPITRYVLNYLLAASASWRMLEEVMDEDGGAHGLGGEAALSSIGEVRPSSSLCAQISWIMELLSTNLDAKSKLYTDPALSHVFLMNNGRYMVQKADGTELGQLLGEDWVRRQRTRVKQWNTGYQRATWGKVLAALRTDDGSGAAGTGAGAGWAAAVREKLRLFSVHVEEIYREQTGWTVGDERLRSDLRASAVGSVVPAYREFLMVVRACRGWGKEMERLVKYSPEDVEARICELFGGGRRRS